MKLAKIDLKKVFFAVFIITVFLISLGCTQNESSLNDSLSDENDLEDQNIVPGFPSETNGEFAAIVNGEEISLKEVQELQNNLSQQGQQISKDDALEYLINQLVLRQKSVEDGFVLTNEDVELELESQLSMQGMTLDDYKEQLELSNISYEEEIERIKKDLLSQQYLSSLIDLNAIEISNEEIELFYEQYISQVEQDDGNIPTLEELRSEIMGVLQQEKMSKAQNQVIQEIRSNADIEYSDTE
jgi:hypothetical protein